MNSITMKPLDAVWLMMESSDTPMHVGVLATFKKPAKAPADYLSQWATKMLQSRDVVAPWNFRLAGGTGSLARPQLVEETDFELDYHFRHSALPAPGGERELGVIVSRLHSHPLDRSRPLWEFHLIEGLERNRFAFYVKIHHALVANVNAIPLLLAMLSASARSTSMPPLWARPLVTGEPESDAGSLFKNPVATLTGIGEAASDLLRSTLRGDSRASFLIPSDTPRSTLNRHINAQRRFATQQFEQARIERLAAATDSTLNEILAYLCGSSLRRFFKEYNALPEASLIGALPVSLQERSESVPGNAIAGIRVALGTHVGSPLARLKAIKEAMQRVRKDRESLPAEATTPYVLLRAAPIYTSQMPVVGRFVPPLFNLGVSNTPGPGEPRYFNGARLEAIYPMGQLMQFSALSIDCVSYAGTLNVGITGARDTLPHLQRIAVYMGKALAELEAIARETEGVQ